MVVFFILSFLFFLKWGLKILGIEFFGIFVEKSIYFWRYFRFNKLDVFRV